MTNDLSHFGVKGMKWRGHAAGVVPPAPAAPVVQKPVNPHAVATAHAAADHNVAVTKTNADLERIHQSYMQQLKGIAQSSPARQKAYNEAKQAHVDNMNKAAHKPKPGVPHAKVPPKKYGIVEKNGRSWGVHLVKPVKHDAFVTDQTAGVSESDILFTITPEYKNGVPSRIPAMPIIGGGGIHHSEDIEEAALAHHGVKGMKWGVRKDAGHEGERAKTKTIAKVDAKFEKAAGTGGASNIRMFVAVHDRAAQKANEIDVPRINNKPQYKGKDWTDPKNAKLYEKYATEHNEAFLKRLDESAKSFGTNASGTREFAIKRVGKDGWDVYARDVKHDAMTPEGSLVGRVKLTLDKLGAIVKLTPVDISLAQSDDLGSLVLVHHGVKGMKWGVRKAGSSAAASLAAQTPKARSARKVEVEADRQKHATPDHKTVEKHLETAKTHGTSALSNKDLREVNDRLNLEQNFARLTVPQKSAGRKFTEDLLRQEGQNAVRGAAKKQVAKAVAKKAAKAAAVAVVL